MAGYHWEILSVKLNPFSSYRYGDPRSKYYVDLKCDTSGQSVTIQSSRQQLSTLAEYFHKKLPEDLINRRFISPYSDAEAAFSFQLKIVSCLFGTPEKNSDTIRMKVAIALSALETGERLQATFSKEKIQEAMFELWEFPKFGTSWFDQLKVLIKELNDEMELTEAKPEEFENHPNGYAQFVKVTQRGKTYWVIIVPSEIPLIYDHSY